MTFSHSGDAGDLIYAMPTVQALGGGTLYCWPHRHTKLNKATVESLADLLEYQPYIDRVLWDKREGEKNLDFWMQCYNNKLSLCAMTLRAFNKPIALANQPWLQVPEKRHIARVIIHRSPRYHAHKFPWERILQKYSGSIMMVGSELEHCIFCETRGYVDYYPTETYMDLAMVITGSDLFIGNQSSPYAVAEGLKHNTIQEVCRECPNCLFDRPNAGYGFDEKTYLPDLP